MQETTDAPPPPLTTATTARAPAEPGVRKRDPEALLLPAAMLAAALIVGAILVYFADRWRKNRDRTPAESENLTSFRAMYEAGEITEAEYRALRDKMAARLKTELPGGLPRITPKPPAGENPPPPSGDGA